LSREGRCLITRLRDIMKVFPSIVLCACLATTGCDRSGEDAKPSSAQSPGKPTGSGRKTQASRGPEEAPQRQALAVEPEIEQLGRRLLKGELSFHDFWLSADGRHPSAQLFAWLLEQDPEQAKQLVAAAPDPATARVAQESLIRAWADRDPLACWDWLRALPSGTARQDLLARALASAAAHGLRTNEDPAGWLALLREMRKDETMSKSAARLEGELATALTSRMGLEKALETIRGNGGEPSAATVNEAIGTALTSDFKTTRAYLEAHPQQYEQWLAAGGDVQMARQMAATSPADAMTWASGLKDSASAERSVAQVVKTWMPVSAEDASRRIQSLPAGGTKDAAVLAMAGWLKEVGSKEEIPQWADSLSSDAARKKLEALARP